MSSLLELARELHREEAGLPTDPDSRAEAIAKEIRKTRDVKVRSAQIAAAKAVGIPTPAQNATEADRADRTRARGAKKRRQRTKRRAKSLAKGARRKGFTSLGLRPGRASVGGLIAQALGLVLLYWLLRNAGPTAAALNGVRRGLLWIFDPTRGIT